MTTSRMRLLLLVRVQGTQQPFRTQPSDERRPASSSLTPVIPIGTNAHSLLLAKMEAGGWTQPEGLSSRVPDVRKPPTDRGAPVPQLPPRYPQCKCKTKNDLGRAAETNTSLDCPSGLLAGQWARMDVRGGTVKRTASSQNSRILCGATVEFSSGPCAIPVLAFYVV